MFAVNFVQPLSFKRLSFVNAFEISFRKKSHFRLSCWCLEKCFVAHQIIFIVAWSISASFVCFVQTFLITRQKLSRNLESPFEHSIHKLYNQTGDGMSGMLLDEVSSRRGQFMTAEELPHHRKQLIIQNELSRSGLVLMLSRALVITYKRHLESFVFLHDKSSSSSRKTFAIWITNGSIFRRAI